MITRFSLYLSWLLASIGLLGSLYFSEIRHFEPCHLCWFQRIFLFPLVILLGIATYNGDTKVIRYALAFPLLGFLVALYQVIIQEIPSFNPIEICGAGPSCSAKIDIGLGFISLPLLSAINFLIIAALLINLKIKTSRKN